jgi:hypothetical protein
MDTFNCSLYTPWGTRVTSCSDLSNGDSIFLVPERRLFMLPTRGVGTTMDIHHLGISNRPIVLETLSESPRIFRIHNFFSEEEANALIEEGMVELQRKKAIQTKIQEESGFGFEENNYSSDEAKSTATATEVTYEDTAYRLRRRAFDLLGVFPYEDSFAEGWQLRHYESNQAYDLHQDWIEPSFLSSHDYNSAYEGTNRYAAIYLYLNTVHETCDDPSDPILCDGLHAGGETVFPLLEPLPGQADEATSLFLDKKRLSLKKKVHDSMKNKDIKDKRNCNKIDSRSDPSKSQSNHDKERRKSVFHSNPEDSSNNMIDCDVDEKALKVSDADDIEDETFTRGNINGLLFDEFPIGSWQQALYSQCRSRFAVKAVKLQALLFYVQKHNGLSDPLTLHGGCPVGYGYHKYIASLWVWNGPKAGSWIRNSDTGRLERPKILSISAAFENLDLIGAKLYWEDQMWEELLIGRPLKVNTYAGHTWQVLLGDDVVASWKIEANEPRQRFVISSEDIPVKFIDYLTA